MTCAGAIPEDSSVFELVGKHINKVDKAVTEDGFVRKWLLRFLDVMADRAQIRLYNKLADGFIDDAIWFKGVDKEIWNTFVHHSHSETYRPFASLVQRIERSKNKLIESRHRLMERQSEAGTSQAVRAAISSALVAEVDLFDAIEAFRWTLIEMQADCSPKSEGYIANTPEELDALFKRMALEE